MSLNPLAWSDDVWLTLDRLGILAGNFMFLFAVGGGLWGFLKRDDIRRWFARNRFPHVGAEMAREQHWDALAFTVSHKELPLWAIDACRPAHVGLIATEQSRTVAQEIAGFARQKGIQVQNPVYLENPDDPAEALAQTRHVLARLREAGAKKIAVDSQPAVDLADRVKLPQFLQAHGTRVIEQGPTHGVREHLHEVTEGLIRHLDKYAKPMRTLNWAANQAEQNNSLKAPPISLAQQTEGFHNLIGWFETADLLQFQNGQIEFTDEEARFFANGGWLESHIYQHSLALKKTGVQDVGRGLFVERQGKACPEQGRKAGPVRNELDVAFLYQNRLHVIECKTKHFDRFGSDPDGADTLYKLDTLRDLLGGLQAKAMLVSYHPLSDADQRRAEDLRIRVLVGSQLQHLETQLKQWIK